MHLVVDDQPPVLGFKEVEVEEVLVLLFAIGQYVIGCYRDGADLLILA